MRFMMLMIPNIPFQEDWTPDAEAVAGMMRYNEELTKAGVAFTLREYDYDPNAARIGMQAAETLGVDPARLLKTLMAKAGNAIVCVLLPSDAEVN